MQNNNNQNWQPCSVYKIKTFKRKLITGLCNLIMETWLFASQERQGREEVRKTSMLKEFTLSSLMYFFRLKSVSSYGKAEKGFVPRSPHTPNPASREFPHHYATVIQYILRGVIESTKAFQLTLSICYLETMALLEPGSVSVK